jgi:hypothetical protein
MYATRYCASYCSSAPVGEPDNGYARGACAGHGAPLRRADDETSRRSVWSLYKQRDVAQRLRSGYLPVDCPLGIAVQGEGDSPP